jgi:hypothetical protein
MSHFPSKEALFIAAVPGTRDLADNVAGDLDGLPGRVARAYVERTPAKSVKYLSEGYPCRVTVI